MNVIEKIKTLTPKEIIMAMVEGLQNPKTKIDMGTFGHEDESGVCFGCAATNCLLTLDPKLTLEKFNSNNGFSHNFDKFGERDFIEYFEDAINELRRGYISSTNQYLSYLGLPVITNKDKIDLPELNDDYTQEDLIPYIKLADSQ